MHSRYCLGMSLQAVKKHMMNADKALAKGATAQAQAALVSGLETLVALMNAEKKSPASQLGALGGTETAKRGPEYFRELAARRKTHGGGRPRKDAV